MAKAISFAQVETRDMMVIPAGKYPCKVAELDYNPESERSGQPALNWQFAVQGGDADGRKLFLNTSLQPQSLWNTLRILVALGYSEAEVKAKDWDFEDPVVIEDIKGRDCELTVRHRTFEGVKQPRITRISALSGADGTEAPF
jgi:hypothetical protein